LHPGVEQAGRLIDRNIVRSEKWRDVNDTDDLEVIDVDDADLVSLGERRVRPGPVRVSDIGTSPVPVPVDLMRLRDDVGDDLAGTARRDVEELDGSRCRAAHQQAVVWMSHGNR